MHASLQKINALPDDVTAYCAHEYTMQNYTFLKNYAPENQAVANRYDEVKSLRDEGKRTVPTTLQQEKHSNLFLTAPTAEAFAKIRQAKDQF